MQVSGKKFLLGLVCWLSLFSYSKAQDVQTSAPVIQQYGWQGCLTQHPGFIWAGTSGGPCPVQRAGDGAILFSYGQNTISQSVAVNQALQGTGIVVRGYSYSWTVKNANAGGNQNIPYDPLTFNVTLTDKDAKIVESKVYDYSYRINDWTTFSGNEDYKNPYSLASLGHISLSITGKDSGYWAGYYGAEINNVSLRLRYSVDPCLSNPLSSPSCPGYQQAFLSQQCTANPLYSPSCPGYEQAYFTQQCSANPLYSPSCPGYQQAYFTQQCSANALFDPTCPGYQQAYFNQQCTINPLYDKKCPGYEQAYFNQQCTLSPLYNPSCPGYEQAFFNQQCAANPLYDRRCPSYEQAYFNQQCNLNALYNTSCPGYAKALFDKTCNENPLSNTSCPLYEQAYLNQQCNINQLFSTSCPLYQQTFFNQQCSANPLYNTGCPGYAEAFRKKQLADACEINPQSNTTCKGYVSPQLAQATSLLQSVSVPPTILLPGTDAVKSMTQPKVVDDPIVNQTLEREPPKLETTPSRVQQAPTQQRSGTREQSTGSQGERRAQQGTARASVSSQPRVNVEQSREDEKMASFAAPPGFAAYETNRLLEIPFYRTEDIYRRATLPDNARAQRQLNQRSDRIHKEMVDEQYRR